MEKLNIAEILKDCPKGMELDCTTYENVEFDYVEQSPESAYPIHCLMKTNSGYNALVFTHYGCNDRHPNAKCVIFPKGKTTWEGFQKPFKNGDILTTEKGSIFIYKGPMYYNKLLADFYCGYIIFNGAFEPKLFKDRHFGDISECRFATEEEKQKLFDAIKANGYKWNAETKTLEKLIKEKFDITTLKPFESRVLVRSSMDGLWKPAVFGFRNGYNDNAFYIVGGSCWKQCIPYLNNEHLCGTTNDCDEYFKTWE